MQYLPGLKGVGGATFLTAVVLLCLSPTASAATLYVDLNNPAPVSPYTNWLTAATNIQDAVDAANAGDQILVSDGVYQTGSGTAPGITVTNRVAVVKAITIRSVNGPAMTIIEGLGGVRCVYLANGAILDGFTLTNGFSPANGGGAFSETTNAVLLNCTLAGNKASDSGGGAFSGTLSNCTVSGNAAGNGCGAEGSRLTTCTVSGNQSTLLWFGLGGGLNNCIATDCKITGNSCYYGAGANGCTLNRCLVSGNSAHTGGGANACVLDRCTITGNWSSSGPGGGGGIRQSTAKNCLIAWNAGGGVAGAESSTVDNCTIVGNTSYGSVGGAHACFATNSIIYGNNLVYGSGLATTNHSECVLDSCCTAPMPESGNANITNSPLFASEAGGDWRLRFNSPCVNSGRTAAVTSSEDLDGAPRVVGEFVDMGAYEFQTAPPAIMADFTSLLPHVAATFSGLLSPEYTTNLYWDFGDGTVLSNNLTAAHMWTAVGDYLVVLRAFAEDNPGGVSATVRVHVATQVISYVNAGGTNPIAPFYSWETAATNVQDAIEAVMPSPESLVMVTNGVYRRGDRRTDDGISNRVAVTRVLTLLSVNGATSTILDGAGAMRCVYLTNGAALAGFTLRNGNADNGAGVWCASNDVVVSRCVIVGSTARLNGGGACGGTLESCALAYNSATGSGGGVFGSILNNCTLVGNSTGAASATLTNCIVYFSTSNNTEGSTLSHCCTTPDPGGTANITTEPQMADFAHIVASSACRGAGYSAFATGVDIDCEAWTNPPAIGCDEYYADAIVGPLNVSIQATYTNVAKGFVVNFSAQVEGHARENLWDFSDGITTTNRLYCSHSWQTPGDYAVTVTAYNDTYPAGVSSSITIHVTGETHYVDVNGVDPVAPYTSWATAAANIQAALDAVKAPGALVLVTNGIYQTGGRVVFGAMSNRVAVTKPLILHSVNGPAATIIQGYKVPGTNFGDSAVRCVYLTNGASLIGFTLTNGATRAAGDIVNEQSGGGLFCYSTNCVVSNCLLTANAACGPAVLYGGNGGGGGGVYSGTLYNCQLKANWAGNGNGGGAFWSVLNDCLLDENWGGNGGGACQSTLNKCWITNNTAGQGGGIYASTFEPAANNCILIGNHANLGGASCGGALRHCTVVSNTASSQGGGAWNSGAVNSVIYYNTAPRDGQYAGGSYLYCCTGPVYPDYDGTWGSIDAPPLFADAAGGNFHLLPNSPCINSGNNDYVNSTTDLEGNPRLVAQYTDMGAYELQGALPPSAYVQADYTNLIVGFAATFNAGYLWGRATSATWAFGDGTIISNTLSPSHAWTAVGDYPVIAQVYAPNNQTGLTAMISVHVTTQIVYYVNASATNPVPPFSSWATAATNIQDAVDVATPWPGSLVLVTNGIYQYGGRVVYGAMTNRLAVTKPIRVESVNGPKSAVIQGHQVPGSLYGDGAVRCVYLTNNAVLTGFTLQGGATRMAGDSNQEQSGAGVWCASTNAVVTNCVLTGNRALWSGGGTYGGTLYNCLISSNQVTYKAGGAAEGANCSSCILVGNSSGLDGGGADQCTLYACELSENTAYSNGGAASSSRLNNCTLTGNTAGAAGGGAYSGTLTNCILCYNRAPSGSNYFGGTLSYCCAQPLPTGTGNLSGDPQLTDRIHIAASSPCRGAGVALSSDGSDIDGEMWLTPPSVGCDEYYAGPVTGPLEVSIHADYTNVAAGFAVSLFGVISGHANLSVWDVGNGTFITNQPNLSPSWNTAGDYPVKLTAYNGSQLGGVSATVSVHVVSQPLHYVSSGSTNPAAPFLSWSTAATNIQDAADVAFPGATVLVTNGVYSLGGRVMFGLLTNRLALSKPMIVQSVNGAAATVIQGNAAPGDSAVRCAYLAEGASLIGFTLTAGATRTAGDLAKEQSGGGVWCWSSNCLVLNCLITSNSASRCGGGAFGGSLSHCTLGTNSAASGGGACSNTLKACTLIANYATSTGGGAYGTRLDNCTVALNTNVSHGAGLHSCVATGSVISNNFSGSGYGGGAYTSSLTNCTLLSNVASRGGGAYNSSMTCCTISGNRASGSYGGGGYGGAFDNCLICSNSASVSSGADRGTLTNCTIVGHTNGRASYYCIAYNSILYYNANNWYSSTLRSCCTWPLPSGSGNFTNPPLFVDLPGGNLRLQTTSPCINAGTNAYALEPTDLDGNPRIAGGRVDLGAYEFQGAGLSGFPSWLWQYGLPTDGSADYTDPDSDHHNNWQEWLAGTNPTNAASVLRLDAPVVVSPSVVLRWSSDTNHTYFVQRANSLATPLAFTTLRGDIPGQAGITSYTDTRAFPSVTAAFYRIGTGPTNTPSPIVVQPPVLVPASATLTWLSVTDQTYYVERATDLASAPAFSLLQSNIPGLPGTTSFTDTNSPPSDPAYYRVGVQP